MDLDREGVLFLIEEHGKRKVLWDPKIPFPFPDPVNDEIDLHIKDHVLSDNFGNWKYKKCRDRNGISEATIKLMIRTFEVPYEEEMKEFLFCVGKQNKIQGKHGKINRKALLSFLITSDPTHDIMYEILLDKCLVNGISGPENAFHTVKCLLIEMGTFEKRPEWWLVLYKDYIKLL